jgi:hypothetical protein
LIGRQSLIEVEDLREVIKGLENADGKIRIRWNRAEAGQGEGVFDEQGRLELKVGEVTPNFNCLELWKALLAVLIAIQSTGREVWAAARETTRGGRAAPRRGLGRRVVQVAAVSGVLVLGLRTPCHVTNEGTEGLAAAQTASQDWKAEEPNIPPCDKANPSATKEAESGNKSLPTQSGSPSWPSARLNVKPAQPSPATKAEEEALEKKSIPAEEKYRGVWRW